MEFRKFVNIIKANGTVADISLSYLHIWSRESVVEINTETSFSLHK